MTASLVQDARAELLERESETLLGGEYARAAGIDLFRASNECGALAVLPVQLLPHRRFDFADADGEPAAIVEAIDADGETVIDLVAWPIARPALVLTMFGRAGLLGAWRALNRATYFAGGRLRVHRTPLGWMQAGCIGAVLFDVAAAAPIVARLPGAILADDDAHAHAVAQAIHAARRGGLALDRRAAS